MRCCELPDWKGLVVRCFLAKTVLCVALARMSEKFGCGRPFTGTCLRSHRPRGLQGCGRSLPPAFLPSGLISSVLVFLFKESLLGRRALQFLPSLNICHIKVTSTGNQSYTFSTAPSSPCRTRHQLHSSTFTPTSFSSINIPLTSVAITMPLPVWNRPGVAYNVGDVVTLYPYEPVRPHGLGQYHTNPLPKDRRYGELRNFVRPEESPSRCPCVAGRPVRPEESPSRCPLRGRAGHTSQSQMTPRAWARQSPDPDNMSSSSSEEEMDPEDERGHGH